MVPHPRYLLQYVYGASPARSSAIVHRNPLRRSAERVMLMRLTPMPPTYYNKSTSGRAGQLSSHREVCRAC